MCGLHTLVEPGIARPASLLLHHWVPQGARAPVSVLGFHSRTVTSQAFSLGLGGIAEWLATSTERSALAGKGRGK